MNEEYLVVAKMALKWLKKYYIFLYNINEIKLNGNK
jgi:hypothetical protein